MNKSPIKRALISVSDKAGIVELGKQLTEQGIEIISTGGTARLLRENKLDVADVSDITQFPEMMDGRLKTLHPVVHGGLLAIRSNEQHVAAQKEHAIGNIDLLIVNLYPFEETVLSGADYANCIENIDIGGPAMIRAAAKNHESVSVIVDPEDYGTLVEEIKSNSGATSIAFRQKLAAKAYALTAAYDANISRWFGRELEIENPRHMSVSGKLKQQLRYGENPHQTALVYKTAEQRPGVVTAKQVQGKELSFNNLNDTDAAFELVAEFDPEVKSAVAIIKHANPCGVAVADTSREAYIKALRCDSVSAFGGIIALNRQLDKETAEEIVKIFTEVVIAPSADAQALEILSGKKNVRILLTDDLPDPGEPGINARTIAGGILVQSRDNGQIDPRELEFVTARKPTDQELSDLLFAFKVCKHVKSNAIVYARDGATVGIGAGQMSRVDSARIASWKSQEAAKIENSEVSLTEGSVVASDAFFPFADGLLAASDAGATAVIQPGGSMRDDEVIATANEKGLAMVFTGMRHFRH
ncbi:MAG: bifunctional phosphoribosylaminoimidazolecarboxamide formyltransferase/IMP cyclohydrolase [Methyloligellaceae bacterium]